MTAILYLLPVSLFMAMVSLIAFFWTVRRKQYQDLEGDSWRVLEDEDYPILSKNSVKINQHL